VRSRPVMLVLAVAASCSGGGDGGSGPDDGSPKMTLASPSGDNQQAAPGTQLEPLRVLIRAGNTPEPGRTVTWAMVQGGGTLSATTTTTDAGGIASVRLTLGTAAGNTRVTAASAGVSGSPITFNAAAVIPGQFAQVDVVNNAFDPASTTIAAGGTVSFRWSAGSRGHNVMPVAPATRPSQPTLRDGPFTHEETFPTAGTYRYFCSAHGTENSGMRGTVVVQ